MFAVKLNLHRVVINVDRGGDGSDKSEADCVSLLKWAWGVGGASCIKGPYASVIRALTPGDDSLVTEANGGISKLRKPTVIHDDWEDVLPVLGFKGVELIGMSSDCGGEESEFHFKFVI